MSVSVGESWARNWQGSRRTHLFNREWGRERRVGQRGNEEVVLKIWMLAAGGQGALAGQCHFPSLVARFPSATSVGGSRQRQALAGSPLGADQRGTILAITNTHFCNQTKPEANFSLFLNLFSHHASKLNAGYHAYAGCPKVVPNAPRCKHCSVSPSKPSPFLHKASREPPAQPPQRFVRVRWAGTSCLIVSIALDREAS